MNSRRYDVWMDRAFLVALGSALVLHVVFFVAWSLMPAQQVLNLPVRMLSVKLGDEQAMDNAAQAVAAAAPPAGNTGAVEASLSRQFSPADLERSKANRRKDAVSKPDKKAADRAREQKASSRKKRVHVSDARDVSAVVAQQYVRERRQMAQLAPAAGEMLGNDPQGKEQKIRSYTQTIALWIEKFKVYPQEARQQGMQGSAMVRIRIDRRGNIHYRIISKRTPYPLLDKAVLDMVRRADPVPPVPADYPARDEFLEFVVPVTFKLDE